MATPKSEREKMLSQEPYVSYDPELMALKLRAQELLYDFNYARPGEFEKRQQILQQLLGRAENCFITPPFYCDYGSHILLGEGTFINYDCVILDCAWVTLGRNVLLAPKVQLYTAYHPLHPAERQAYELAKPITIGDNVWLGGGAIVCPGVTIGENSVIGAGSVVTKDIPANVIAVGNPCRVVRPL